VLVGSAPLATEILADPGPHEVGVVLDGHTPSLERVSLERGKTRSIEVELETTGQRKAAWVLIAVGGAGVAASIVLGALAVVEQRKADDLVRGPNVAQFADQLSEYTDTVDARDRNRVAPASPPARGRAVRSGGAFAFDAATLPAGAKGERSGWVVLPLLGPSEIGLLPTFHTQW
jgi:hypothetical protein